MPSVIVTIARARAAAVIGRLISSIVLIVPATAVTFEMPSGVSRQLAGSPAQTALVCTPAVTTAVTSTSASVSVAIAA